MWDSCVSKVTGSGGVIFLFVSIVCVYDKYCIFSKYLCNVFLKKAEKCLHDLLMRSVTVLISFAIVTFTTWSLYYIVTHTAFYMYVVVNLLGTAYVFG